MQAARGGINRTGGNPDTGTLIEAREIFSGADLIAAVHRQALGAPAHRPAHVQVRSGGTPAREHERAQRRELGVHLVTALLEPGRLLGGDPQALAFGIRVLGRRDVGADIEQVILDALQPGEKARRHVGDRERDSDLRVALIHRPVRLDPRVSLGDAAHVPEVRLARIAEAGVDARQVDRHRSVSLRGAAHRDTIVAFKVGGDGKPVRDRRGPATVIGDASRNTKPLVRATAPGRRGR